MSRAAYLFHVRPFDVRQWTTGVPHLAVGFGAVVVALSLNAHAVQAGPTTAKSAWCVETAGVPPDCTYDSYLSCAVAAIGAGGLCKAASSMPADAVDPSRNRAAASPRPGTQSTTPTTTHQIRNSAPSKAEREKLFREFVEWSRRRSNP